MRFRELLEGKMYVVVLKRKEVRNEGLKLEIIYCESWVEEKTESQDKSVQYS